MMTADTGPGPGGRLAPKGRAAPLTDPADPRYEPGAYVKFDGRLYDVVGLDGNKRLRVINSRHDADGPDETVITLSLYHTRLVQLVREAPTIRVPDTVA